MRIDRIKLKVELARREMSHADFATVAGISKGTLSGVANGRSCNEITARKIAKALEMSLDELKEEQR